MVLSLFNELIEALSILPSACEAPDLSSRSRASNLDHLSMDRHGFSLQNSWNSWMFIPLKFGSLGCESS